MSVIKSILQSVLSLDVTTILVFLLVLIVTYYVFKSLTGPKLPPGPPRLPIIGSVLSIDDNVEFWKESRRLSKKYNSDILTLDTYGRIVILLNSYELAKEAFQKRDDMADRSPGNFFKYMESGYQGILSSSGQVWKEQRRFTLFMLRDSGMGKVGGEQYIQDEAIQLCKRIEQVSTDKGFDPLPILEPAVSNIICHLAFGERFEYDNDEFNVALTALNDVVGSFSSKFATMCLSPAVRWLVPYLYPEKYNTLHSEYKVWGAFVRKIIKQHVDKFDGSVHDLIDAFLAEKEKKSADPDSSFTDDQLRYLIQDLFLAGSETTTTTLRWSLLYLVKYPEIQEKIYDELINAIGHRTPTMGDKRSTPYTEAYLLEVQRYNTIVPNAVAHGTSVDLEFHGYTIPAGCFIVSNLAAIHRDERVFEDPNTFKVERFLDNGKTINGDKVNQFGIGRRACAGEALARMEVYLFFVEILLKFKIEPTGDEVQLKGSRAGIFAPLPFKIRATRREQS